MTAAVSAQADLLPDAYIGASAWMVQPSGFVRDGTDEVDLETDLDLSEEVNFFAYAALEDVLSITPFVPDVKVMYTQISTDGENDITRSINFAGQDFNVSDSVVSEFDLTMIDGTLYWELLDNMVSLDLGVTARQLDFSGEVVSATTGVATVDESVILPLGYISAQVDLPLSGLYFAVEGNGLSISDNGVMDLLGKVGYESSLGLGIEAGYRTFSLEIEDLGDFKADMQTDGFFAGLRFHL